jgi:hypothetical protein
MPARWADEGPKRERPCKSERMGESEDSLRSVMVATSSSCEGKCQPEGWLPPTGRSVGYRSEGPMVFRPRGRCRLQEPMTMPAARAEDQSRKGKAARADQKDAWAVQ